jgi:hypothetical protein
MTKIALSPNASGTGTFTIEAPNSNSNRTLVLPDEAGTVLTNETPVVLPKGIPVFSAYSGTGQALSAATNTKILFDQEDFDTAGSFASSRFTPNVAGFYQFNCGVRTDDTISALHVKLSASTVGEFAAGSFTNTSVSSFMSSCSGVVFLDGAGNFVEVFAFSGSNITLNTGRTGAYFQGFLVRAGA